MDENKFFDASTKLEDSDSKESIQHNVELYKLCCYLFPELLNAEKVIFSYSDDEFTTLKNIVMSINKHVIQVGLTKKWWENDAGRLIGKYKGEPCALLPQNNGGYQIFMIKSNQTIAVNNETANDVSEDAFVFYDELPSLDEGIWRTTKFLFSTLASGLKYIAFQQILISVLVICILMLFSDVFSQLYGGNNYFSIKSSLSMIIILVICLTLFRFSQTYSLNYYMNASIRQLSLAVWLKIYQLPHGFFHHHSTQGLFLRLRTMSKGYEFILRSMIYIVMEATSIVIFSGVLLYLDWNLFALSFTCIIIAALLLAFSSKRLGRVYDSYEINRFKSKEFMYDILRSVPMLRIKNVTGHVEEEWSEHFASENYAKFEILKSVLNQKCVLLLVFSVAIALQIAFLTFQTIAQLFFMTGISVLLFYYLLRLYGNMLYVLSVSHKKQILMPLKNAFVSVKKSPLLSLVPNGYLTINHLSFRYTNEGAYIINDISLNIKPGEWIGILGDSGSGKSTFMRLLSGLEDPSLGEILYGHIPMNQSTFSILRASVGFINENIEMFPGTVFSNITGNDKSLTKTDVWYFAKEIGVYDLIDDLPMKLDTIFYEGLEIFSNSEKIAVLLLRALIKKPKYVLIDIFDGGFDELIREQLFKYLHTTKSTVIVSSSSIEEFKDMKKVIVLKGGNLITSGTYEEIANRRTL